MSTVPFVSLGCGLLFDLDLWFSISSSYPCKNMSLHSVRSFNLMRIREMVIEVLPISMQLMLYKSSVCCRLVDHLFELVS